MTKRAIIAILATGATIATKIVLLELCGLVDSSEELLLEFEPLVEVDGLFVEESKLPDGGFIPDGALLWTYYHPKKDSQQPQVSQYL